MSGADSSYLHDWGIETTYRDSVNRRRTPPPATIAAVAHVLGAVPGSTPPASTQQFVREGTSIRFDARHDVLTEGGREVTGVLRLPRDIPTGYHQLRNSITGAVSDLVVAPLRCHLEPQFRTWGWSSQLYATRSRKSWGIGDLGDLETLGAWGRRLGAGMILVNPLHAALPGLPQETSPYYPSSRRYRNPLYIRVEHVPGAGAMGEPLEQFARAGRALNSDPLIDRDQVFRLKMGALELLWSQRREWPGFEAYVATEGVDLISYATFCVLCEEFGPRWRCWPEAVRHPHADAIAEVTVRRHDRVRFHAWLQWLLDEQMTTAARALPTMHDLAIGVDPGGADAWLYQDVMASGFSVGAPPDIFNSLGQSWGLPPFDPWRLRAANYRPLIAIMRAGLRHGGGLRIDHIMGLFRLFWVPEGEKPHVGTYVRYPHSDLLDLIALESTRGGAMVAGEDLGTVEPFVRRQLALRNILTYRVMWFEQRSPEQYPVKALAAATTHDLPTIAGLRSGSDFAEQLALGREPDPVADEGMRVRLRRLTGCAGDATVEDLVAATYAALGRSPSALLCAALDDLLGVKERPNMPGTTRYERPNWCVALPSTIEEFRESPLAARIAAALNRREVQKPTTAPVSG